MPAYLKDDEEDFRDRYARDTAGMPTDLAAIASRNLATQDAAMGKVNAVARLVPQSSEQFAFDAPLTSDLGSPTSSAPASLSDLHSEDIASRRTAIADQKKQTMARLGIISPKEAGLAAVVLAGPKERKELLQNMALLEREEDNLLREHHQVATLNARRAHETFARQKHIDADTDFVSLTNELAEIRKTTKRGTPEREEALSKAVANHPAGFTVKAGQELVRQMAKEQDAAAVITLPPGFEQTPSSVTANGKISYDVKPKGTAERAALETELKEKYGLTPAQIKAPGNIESGNVDKDGNFVNANKGTHFRVTTKEGQFQIPREEFERFGGHIGDADKTDQPAAIPPAPEREKGAVYDTPKGKMKWTGTGWVQA